MIPVSSILKIQIGFSGQSYIDAVLFFIALLIPAFFVLIQSLKPEFTKIFCELEAQQKHEPDLKSETVKIEDKVA